MNNTSSNISSFDLSNFISFLLSGDRKNSLDYIQKHSDDNSDFIKIYEEVIKKSLYLVGEMWEKNKISVASEHLATSTTDSLLNHIFQNVQSTNKIGKKIMIANTENEVHHVGIKMVADVFESYGWETFLLTGVVSHKVIIQSIKINRPDILALSLSIRTNLPSFRKTLEIIRAAYPDLPIILGGQAFSKEDKEVFYKFNNTRYIQDLYALRFFIEGKSVQ